MLNALNHSSYLVKTLLQPTRVVNVWLPQNLQSYLYPNSRASEIYHRNTMRGRHVSRKSSKDKRLTFTKAPLCDRKCCFITHIENKWHFLHPYDVPGAVPAAPPGTPSSLPRARPRLRSPAVRSARCSRGPESRLQAARSRPPHRLASRYPGRTSAANSGRAAGQARHLLSPRDPGR